MYKTLQDPKPEVRPSLDLTFICKLADAERHDPPRASMTRCGKKSQMSYLNSNVTSKGFDVSMKEGSTITAVSIRDSISFLQKDGKCLYDRYCKWKTPWRRCI